MLLLVVQSFIRYRLAQKFLIADFINVISLYVTVSAKNSTHDPVNGIAKSIYPVDKKNHSDKSFSALIAQRRRFTIN
jgi:hypothetical protein